LKFTPRSAATGILLLAGFALYFPHDEAAQAARPLTAEQVACEADQLRAVLGRSALLFGLVYDDRTAMFLFTYGAASGALSGVALMEQSDTKGQTIGPEHQLSFTVGPSRRKPQRDPGQPQVNAFYLQREPLGSDIGLMEDEWAMAVIVDPTTNPLGNQDASTLLVVDNVDDSEGGLPSTGKPGRGLMTLLNRCHNTFTAADLHVFDVLSRLVRADAYTTKEGDPKAEHLHKLASIYRGADAVPIPGGVRASYRIDFYPVPVTGTLRRVSLEMKIDLGDDGSLGDATLRVLPACGSDTQLGCSSAPGEAVISVVRPGPAEQLLQEAAPTVCWRGGTACPSKVTFSFAERLQGTSWLRP
jgi:hypothetical protein